jgi:hypothetical protein
VPDPFGDLLAAHRAWLQTFVESVVATLDIAAEDALHILSLVDAACEDGLITQLEGSDLVVIRTLASAKDEVFHGLISPNPPRAAWLVLVFKVLITAQVRLEGYIRVSENPRCRQLDGPRLRQGMAPI